MIPWCGCRDIVVDDQCVCFRVGGTPSLTEEERQAAEEEGRRHLQAWQEKVDKEQEEYAAKNRRKFFNK